MIRRSRLWDAVFAACTRTSGAPDSRLAESRHSRQILACHVNRDIALEIPDYLLDLVDASILRAFWSTRWQCHTGDSDRNGQRHWQTAEGMVGQMAERMAGRRKGKGRGQRAKARQGKGKFKGKGKSNHGQVKSFRSRLVTYFHVAIFRRHSSIRHTDRFEWECAWTSGASCSRPLILPAYRKAMTTGIFQLGPNEGHRSSECFSPGRRSLPRLRWPVADAGRPP